MIALQPNPNKSNSSKRNFPQGYTNAAEALHLLEKCKHCVSLRGGANLWVEDLRVKIDIAAAQSDRSIIYV